VEKTLLLDYNPQGISNLKEQYEEVKKKYSFEKESQAKKKS